MPRTSHDGKKPKSAMITATVTIPSDVHAAALALGALAPTEYAPIDDLVVNALRAVTGLPEGGERASLLTLAEGLALARAEGLDAPSDADIFAALVGRPGYPDEVDAFATFRHMVVVEDAKDETREFLEDQELEALADLKALQR